VYREVVVMVYIVGEYLNFKDGILLWSACNGATRRVLKLLRAPNVSDDQFVQYGFDGCDTPAYRLENATVRWLDTEYKETSVFVVAAENPEPKTVYIVLNGAYGFRIFPHPLNPSPTHIVRTSIGSRGCSEIAVVTAPVFIGRLGYDGDLRDHFYLAEDAPYYLGSRNAVIAKAFANDDVCRQLMQQAGWDIGTL
jgi:hypothetical protein